MWLVVYFDQRFAANFSKKEVFLSLHQNVGWLFYSQKMRHFKGKNVFLEKKAHFFGNKTVSQLLGANSKKHVFLQKFAANFLLFLSFFAEKMLRMTISTSVWTAQHPNAGRNIQQWLLRSNLCQTSFNCRFYHEYLVVFTNQASFLILGS